MEMMDFKFNAPVYQKRFAFDQVRIVWTSNSHKYFHGWFLDLQFVVLFHTIHPGLPYRVVKWNELNYI